MRGEAEILDRLSNGYRSEEIGDPRGIITLTVNTHIRNYEKLHVRSRAEPVLRSLAHPDAPDHLTDKTTEQ